MKLSDFVANYIVRLNRNCYGVSGGMAMHLNDSIMLHPDINFVSMHHEQAAAFAAEGDARVSNRIGLVHVTAGPGVTNTMTGVACAWADSIPMMVIAGQVETKTLKADGLRQHGISEVDGVALMTPITKYAVCVRDPRSIRFVLDKASHLAKSGRPGPVYIEIPIDVQCAEIDPEQLAGYEHFAPINLENSTGFIVTELMRAERPVILFGNGVRLAGAQSLVTYLGKTGYPILTTWNASDLIDHDNPNYIGKPGLIGNRAANYAVQNCDLLLVVGSRLSVPITGHFPDKFAANAKIIMVDADRAELDRVKPYLAVRRDILEFAHDMIGYDFRCDRPRWLRSLQEMRDTPEPREEPREGINAYAFLESLAEHLDDDAIIVTDVGTAFVTSQQSLKLKSTQRLFHSSGIAPMGYGLPAAIGAHFAAPERQVVLLAGDGGFMFNIQELATVKEHNIPLKMFVFCNNGYATMRTTQNTHFKREIKAPKIPNYCEISEAFDIEYDWLHIAENTKSILKTFFHWAPEDPRFLKVILDPNQVIAPVVKARMKEGKFIPTGIEDMWPHAELKELVS